MRHCYVFASRVGPPVQPYAPYSEDTCDNRHNQTYAFQDVPSCGVLGRPSLAIMDFFLPRRPSSEGGVVTSVTIWTSDSEGGVVTHGSHDTEFLLPPNSVTSDSGGRVATHDTNSLTDAGPCCTSAGNSGIFDQSCAITTGSTVVTQVTLGCTLYFNSGIFYRSLATSGFTVVTHVTLNSTDDFGSGASGSTFVTHGVPYQPDSAIDAHRVVYRVSAHDTAN
jgi:hypothetical protein